MVNSIQVNYKLYHTTKMSFGEKLDDLLSQYNADNNCPVRLVFFDQLNSNEEYRRHLTEIQNKVRNIFGAAAPTISLVAQPPLVEEMGMEVHEIVPSEENLVHYKNVKGLPYIVVESWGSKRLFVSGIMGDLFFQNIRGQADEVFNQLAHILQREEMPISSIVRQWNYVEKITAIDDRGHQHYQDFNDSRSTFYQHAQWIEGYPAATGIGTDWGGVVVDVDALYPKQSIAIKAIDNSLQVSAHIYSQQVLLGKADAKLSQRTTPKFERAKALYTQGKGMVYISGTAAIRGEKSLEGISLEEQTLATLENIKHLISAENLWSSGLSVKSDAVPVYFRVYVKQGEDVGVAQRVVEEHFPNLPVIYTEADICRSELLVEIEGVALIY